MRAAPPPLLSRVEAKSRTGRCLPKRWLRAGLTARPAPTSAPRPPLNDRLQAAAAAAMPGGRRDVLGVRIAPALLRFGAALPGRRYRAALSVRNLRAGSCRLRLLPPRRPQVRGGRGAERSGAAAGGRPPRSPGLSPASRRRGASAAPPARLGGGRASGGPARGPLRSSGSTPP